MKKKFCLTKTKKTAKNISGFKLLPNTFTSLGTCNQEYTHILNLLKEGLGKTHYFSDCIQNHGMKK